MATQTHSGRTQPPSQHWQQIGKSAEEILNVRTEMARRRRWLSALIDWLGRVLAHPAFFFFLLITHLLWTVLNLPLYPWFKPWDPYPYYIFRHGRLGRGAVYYPSGAYAPVAG